MRRILVPTLALGILIAAGQTQAAGQYPSWQGQWKIINDTGTEYPASFPKIENHVITVSKDDGNKLVYTDRWVIAGKEGSSSFDGAYDGKPYRTSDGHNQSYEHVAGGYQDHWTDDKGTVGEDHCTFTPDGLHMNCTGSTTPKGGQKLSYKEHWDKIQ
ncbi:MAG TPA: hypothetical protein VKZ79_09045 [Alphaproteobacteria bacterium]|nr:hypothetical protein [Alphaproteobacteria bacterium]